MTALHWLTANNPLYKDIQIDCGNIDVQLTDMTHNENYQTTLLTNPPPADYSSSTSVAEPDLALIFDWLIICLPKLYTNQNFQKHVPAVQFFRSPPSCWF